MVNSSRAVSPGDTGAGLATQRSLLRLTHFLPILLGNFINRMIFPHLAVLASRILKRSVLKLTTRIVEPGIGGGDLDVLTFTCTPIARNNREKNPSGLTGSKHLRQTGQPSSTSAPHFEHRVDMGPVITRGPGHHSFLLRRNIRFVNYRLIRSDRLILILGQTDQARTHLGLFARL